MGTPLSNSPMRVAIVTAVLLAAAGNARGETHHTCAVVESDAIAVDGMLDDWQGLDKVRIGGADKDASLDARCAIEGAAARAGSLAMSFDVRDEHVVRSAVAVGPGDDLLEIRISIGGGAPVVVSIAPGLGKIDPQVKIDGKPAPRGFAVETTLQRAGWSAELVVPLAKLRGWKDGTAELTADVRYRDGDVMHAKAAERTVGDELVLSVGDGGGDAGPGAPPPPSAKDSMKAFLDATGLAKADVTLDATGDVDPTTKGAERVVAGRRVIGIVGARFTYVQLPVDADGDVIARPRLVDLRGDGSRVIVLVARQQGGGGTRDVLLGFGARGGNLVQLFAIEVRRERGRSKLESEWSIAKGKRPQIVVRAKPAVGWDADTYDEAPAGDAEPIALPWDDDRWGAAYTLDGDALSAHALPGRRPGR